MRILIVAVNYNTFNIALKYLDSIQIAYTENPHCVLDVILADNSDVYTTNSKKYKFNFQYYYIGQNLGYIPAVSFVLKALRITLEDYDYFIISNVDLTLKKTFFANLLSLPINKNIGWIAPSIYSVSELRDRNPKMLTRPSIIHLNLLILMYRFPILYKAYYSLFYKKRNKIKQNKCLNGSIIYAGHGSFMIFTKSFLMKYSDFSFPSFLFGEESYFAEIVRKNNLSVLYEKSLCVLDEEHASTNKIKRKTFYKWNLESLLMIKKIFYTTDL